MHRRTVRRAVRRVLVVIAMVAMVATFAPAQVAVAGPAISISRVLTGVVSPTQVTNANDGTNRLFVVEQRGAIRVIENGRLRSSFFLDIRSRIGAGGERGLLGVAFHPQFRTNRKLYVYYTRKDGDIVLCQFTAANAARTWASAKTARPLLVIEHSSATNHNGGALAFGPDGYLYVGIGDGGGAGDPEGDSRSTTRSLLGKVLRIDVNSSGAGSYRRYGIPPSNPYAGPATGLDEVWARGLRNPWRISFDRSTGALWIGDVGQGRREEVNRQEAGAGGRDYGWNIMEGSLCYRTATCPLAGDTLPVTEYGHDAGNCSITGGYVYRGAAYPAIRGRYIFGDFCSGRIWTIPATGTNLSPEYATRTGLRITSFGEDEAGELYFVTASGGLYRVRA